MANGLHLDKPYDKFTKDERSEQARIDGIGVALGSLAGCVTSMLHRIADVTAEERAEIEDLYKRALDLSTRIMAHSIR